MWNQPIAHEEDIRNVVGGVFELVAQRIFKGKLCPKRHFVNGDVHPDLEAPQYNAQVEVKAGQTTNFFKISPVQVEKYAAMTEDPFFTKNILYAFFGHRLLKIWDRYQGRAKRLVAEGLISRSQYLVVLDFSVVLVVLQKLELGQYKSYERLWKWEQRVNQAFIKDPQSALIDCGFASDDFSIRRRSVTFRFGRAEKEVPSVWILQKSADHA